MPFVYWLVVTAIGAVIAMWIGSKAAEVEGRWGKDSWKTKVCMALATGAIMSVFFGLALSPGYYEFPGWPCKVVVVQNDGSLVNKPWGAWESEYPVSIPINGNAIASVQSEVTPITDNPKIRTLRYELKTELVSPEKFFKAKPERAKAGLENALNELAEYWAYEFNNQHSKQVAEFYNPRDPAQQEKFNALVETFINERTEPQGLKVKCAGFSLPPMR